MQSIGRFWDGKPTMVENKIEEGCLFENTLVGIGTIIIDKDFINEIKLIANELKDDKNLVSLLTKVYSRVGDYFSSLKANEKSREETYLNDLVVDEEGMIIGTKMSSLKGKNISKCSEKSIAAYIILEELYSMGITSRKPALTLSHLNTASTEPEPHAFVLLNNDKSDNQTKHLLFDVENPTLVENKVGGQQQYFVGLYSLNDEQYEKLINGLECTPTSLYELVSEYREVSPKRTFGNIEKTKSL